MSGGMTFALSCTGVGSDAGDDGAVGAQSITFSSVAVTTRLRGWTPASSLRIL
jgi:hypothetical protein